MRNWLLVSVLLACLAAASCDRVLIPVTHTSVDEIGRILLGKPALTPQGISSLWTMPDYGAIVAEGTPEALARLDETVRLFDQPLAQMVVDVKAYLLPVDLARTWTAAGMQRLWASSQHDGAPFWMAGALGSQLSDLRESGCRQVPMPWRYPITVSNNHTKSIWMGNQIRSLLSPEGIGAGLSVTPRLNADDTVTIFIALIEMLPDPAGGRVDTKAGIQWTSRPTESVVARGSYITLPEGGQYEVLVVLTAKRAVEPD